MDHDFTLDQLQLIFTAVTERFNVMAKLSEDFPEVAEIRKKYANLMGVVNKVRYDRINEKETEE